MKTNKTLSLAGIGVLCLGVVTALSAPAVYAATTTTTVSSAINSVISLLSSNGTVNVNVIPTASGAQTTSSDTVTVSTNNSAGYTLQVAETTGSSAMVDGANSVPAIGGTQASPTALTANTWGYRVDGIGGFGAGPTGAISNAAIGSVTYAAVPATASPNTIKTTAATATNDTTTVWYSLAANTSTPSGTYTNSVTYTATAN